MRDRHCSGFVIALLAAFCTLVPFQASEAQGAAPAVGELVEGASEVWASCNAVFGLELCAVRSLPAKSRASQRSYRIDAEVTERAWGAEVELVSEDGRRLALVEVDSSIADGVGVKLYRGGELGLELVWDVAVAELEIAKGEGSVVLERQTAWSGKAWETGWTAPPEAGLFLAGVAEDLLLTLDGLRRLSSQSAALDWVPEPRGRQRIARRDGDRRLERGFSADVAVERGVNGALVAVDVVPAAGERWSLVFDHLARTVHLQVAAGEVALSFDEEEKGWQVTGGWEKALTGRRAAFEMIIDLLVSLDDPEAEGSPESVVALTTKMNPNLYECQPGCRLPIKSIDCSGPWTPSYSGLGPSESICAQGIRTRANPWCTSYPDMLDCCQWDIGDFGVTVWDNGLVICHGAGRSGYYQDCDGRDPAHQPWNPITQSCCAQHCPSPPPPPLPPPPPPPPGAGGGDGEGRPRQDIPGAGDGGGAGGGGGSGGCVWWCIDIFVGGVLTEYCELIC